MTSSVIHDNHVLFKNEKWSAPEHSILTLYQLVF